MNSNTFAEAGIRTGEKLRVFALHIDNSAAGHVNWLKSQFDRLGENELDFSFRSCMLSSVISHNPDAEAIAREAAESDVLVIATTSLHHREPALVEWLGSLPLTDEDRQSPGLLVGLFGDENNQAAQLDWMVRELVEFTRRTRNNFVWRWMEPEAMSDNNWLAACLEESCARSPSVINYQLANSIW